MWKSNRLLRLCVRIIVVVILLSFWKPFPVFAEPLKMLSPNLSEIEMRFYTDSEVELLIDALSEIAKEAIEQAAATAAKEATLAAIDREAAAVSEAMRLQAEVIRWRTEAETQQRNNVKAGRVGFRNTVIAALVGLMGGAVVGIAVSR